MAILTATFAWFLTAGLLFFNPWVDKVYSQSESHPSVKALPKNGQTMLKIILAILVQCILWAAVYDNIKSSLNGDAFTKGLWFGTIISLMKMIPRDIDRALLTTYPPKRMTIEFVNGIVCSYVVAGCFSYMIV